MKNPYSNFLRQEEDPWEKVMRENAMRNQALGVGSAEMAQSGMYNPYGIAPKDARALRDAPGQIAQAEREADRQRQVAEMMRGQAPKVIQGNSRIQAANPYNALAQVAMGGLSGLAAGRAREADESADEQRKALAQATAAREEALFGIQRGDVADKLTAEYASIGAANARNAADIASRERIAEVGEQGKNARSVSTGFIDFPDGSPSIPFQKEGGVYYRVDPKTGLRGESFALPENVVVRDTQATGSEPFLEGLKQAGREKIENLKAEDRQELERLKAKLDVQGKLEVKEQERLNELQKQFNTDAELARGETLDYSPMVNNISSLLENPLFGQYTGMISAESPANSPVLNRLYAKYITDSPNSGEAQALNQNIESVSQDEIVKYLQVVAPASEFEYRVSKLPVPDATSPPYAHIDFHTKGTFQDMKQAHEEAVRAARKTGDPTRVGEAELRRQRDMEGLAKTLLKASLEYGYPASELKRVGLAEYLPDDLKELFEQLK